MAKRKISTKLGIIALALMCLVCSFVCTTACSADEIVYTVAYLDATTNETIAAEALVKEGYTAKADVYTKTYQDLTLLDFNGDNNYQVACDFLDEITMETSIVVKWKGQNRTVNTVEYEGVTLMFFGTNDGEWYSDFENEKGATTYSDYQNIFQIYSLEGSIYLLHSRQKSGVGDPIPEDEVSIQLISVNGVDVGVETKIESDVNAYTYTATQDCTLKVTYTKTAAVTPAPSTEDDSEVEAETVELKGWSKFKADCENNWKEFTNFFTEDIPNFFTKTIPDFFTGAWNKIVAWFKGE